MSFGLSQCMSQIKFPCQLERDLNDAPVTQELIFMGDLLCSCTQTASYILTGASSHGGICFCFHMFLLDLDAVDRLCATILLVEQTWQMAHSGHLTL